MEALAKKRCSFARLLFFLSTPSAPGSAATTKGDTPVDEEHVCLLSLARRAEERERTRNKLSEVSVFFWGGGFLFRSLSLSLREMDGGGSASVAGLRARPAEQRLCRAPDDLRAVRPVAALRPSQRGLQQFRFRERARFRAEMRGPFGQGSRLVVE